MEEYNPDKAILDQIHQAALDVKHIVGLIK
jgi:hypothetical protein